MSKTVCFITRNFGKYDPDSLKGYESIGGFRALRKALTMEGCDIADVLAATVTGLMFAYRFPKILAARQTELEHHGE